MQFQNYPGFKELLDKYQKYGFQLIAFPCNQFGAQAPGSDACERAYIYKKLGVSAGRFPVFDHVTVNGPGISPVYAFLKAKMFSHGTVFGEIAWNYEKFLVNGDGVPVHRHPSQMDPMTMEKSIRGLLGLEETTTMAPMVTIM